MNKVKNLIPPLELCKKIPAGEFAESYAWYCWSYIDQKYLLCAGGKPDVRLFRDPCPCGMKYFYPAPMLQEIMENMTTLCVTPEIFHAHKNYWTAQGEVLNHDGMYKFHHGCSSNPATAALELWLKLKGIEA